MPVDFVARPPYNVVQPGAYSAVNASELQQPSSVSVLTIPALLGQSEGGKPNEALYFSSPSLLLSVLRGGPLYDAARFCLAAGAPQICVVRVGKGLKQASIKLKGKTPSTNEITLTSIDFGVWTNAIKIVATEGASASTLELKYTDALGNKFKEEWKFTSTMTLGEMAEAINGKVFGFTGSNFVTAELTKSGGTETQLVTVAETALTGGAEEAPTATQWEEGLKNLENQEVNIIVPVTGEATIHAKVLEHCLSMSNPNTRKERTMVVGGVKGETVAQAIARLSALRSARVELVYPGLQDYNTKGEVTTFDPFYAAAKVAGMWAAQPDVATSLVHQRVPCVNVETQLSTVQGAAVDELLLAGVTPFTLAPRSGVWIVDAISTNTEPSGFFRDFHKTRSADYVARFVRGELEAKFTGAKALNGTAERIEIKAALLLKELMAAKIIRAFLNPTIEPGPQNTSGVVTATNSFNLSLPVMLVDATKYIFITVSLQTSITIAASG